MYSAYGTYVLYSALNFMYSAIYTDILLVVVVILSTKPALFLNLDQ